MRLQGDVWGEGFTERVPASVLRVAQYVGGVTAGAFDEADRLLGFVFGVTGVRDGRLVHWSDMLAVRPEARDGGLGTRLKLFQRELVVPLGVTTMYWTFDPLVARNAHLNVNRLGARPVEYVPDMYGPDMGGTLHPGLGTDRLVVAWDLTATPPRRDLPSDEPRLAEAGAAPAAEGPAPIVNDLTDAASASDGGGLAADAGASYPSAPTVRIEIPADLHAVAASAPHLGRRWRVATRRAFLWYLARGYQVAGVRRDAATGRVFYWLMAAA